MALEEKMKEPEATNPAHLTEEEELDVRIASRLGEQLLEDGGFDVIEKAIATSSDPAQVIGQFLMQLIVQMNEEMPADVELSKRIYLAEGGVIEQLIDFIGEEMGVDRKILDRAEIFVATTSEQMAQSAQQQQANPQAQQAQPPAMPQQGGY